MVEASKMLSSRLIPFHVPSYDGIAALQKDTVKFVDETWCTLLARSNNETSSSRFYANELSIIDDDNQVYHRLRHSLSSSALNRVGGKPSGEKLAQTLSKISKRNDAELAALNIFCADINIAISSANADSFVTCLENIVSNLLNIDTRIRTTPSIILPDQKGVGWQCVPVNEVVPRLGELHRYIAAHQSQSPLQTAIVALVMISCIHPFMDGNGRASRVIFHAILRKYGVSEKLYVPLKSFYAQSDFGFEIRLRQTFLTSDWNQITRYFCDVLHAFLR
jgi:Fic/DOC family